MKKLMFAAAIIAAGAAFATDGITSANVVGYHSVEIFNGQMNLLNAPWQTIVNADGKVELQNCMSRTGLVSMDEDGNPGDYINTWNFSTGTWGRPYFYINQSESGYPDGWYYEDKGDYTASLVELDPGAAFWLYHGGDSKVTLTFNGEIATGTAGYALMAGQMNLCGNPYPTVLDLNASAGQVTITGATSMDEDGNPGDYINTWNFSTGTWGRPYFYINQSESGYPDGWYYENKGDYTSASTAIPVGSGFWYYAVGTPSLTFTNPVK